MKQIINEPRDRIYIGDKPLLFERVLGHRTKYIKGLHIDKVEGYCDNYGVWFDNVSIPFNEELVAIIGNKGSGKSAISDILSLCANHNDEKEFSFLTSQKFREKSGRISKNFNATLKWQSGVNTVKNLDESPDLQSDANVKYIPQGTFERLTNEVSSVEEFQREIESVVFSHIPESEKLDSKSFSELIQTKSSVVSKEIASIKYPLQKLNEQIIELEKKASPTYRKEIESKLNRKRGELESLVKPLEVANPNQDPEHTNQNEEERRLIRSYKEEIIALEKQITAQELSKKNAFNAIQKLQSTKTEIQNKEDDIKSFVVEITEKLSMHNIDIDKLIKLRTNYSEINLLIQKQESKLNEARVRLGETECEEN